MRRANDGRHHPAKALLPEDRVIQYSDALLRNTDVAGCWIPAFAGMTAVSGSAQCIAVEFPI